MELLILVAGVLGLTLGWLLKPRKNKEFLNLVTRFASVPMFIKDGNFRLIYVNDSYVKFVGRERINEAAMDKNTFYPVEEKVLDTGEPTSYTHHYMKEYPSGLMEKEVKVVLARIEIEGKFYVLGEIIDITDIEAYKRIAELTEDQYQQLVEKVSDLILSCDKDLKI